MTELEPGDRVAGQYAVGWIKRGPSGVIGTNKKDAQETVDGLIEDVEAGTNSEPRAGLRPRRDRRAAGRARARTWSAFRDGRRSTGAERDRGEPLGRPRVKFVRIAEMLEAARAAEPVSELT